MPFTLTVEHFRSILDPAEAGDWSKFVGAFDPEVHWVVADPEFHPRSLAGTYVYILWSPA